MDEHYLTVLANDGGQFAAGCRCGWLWTGPLTSLVHQYYKHREV